MSDTTRRHWRIAAGLALALLLLGGLVAFRAAVGLLKDRVGDALGPTSEVGALRVGWAGVVIEGLRIPAPKGWPTKDALRAERVTIVPSLSSLVASGSYRIASITITRPYLSAVRRSGKLLVLPGLHREVAEEVREGGVSNVLLSEITLDDGVLELFDPTVAQPPLAIRLEQLEGSIQDVSLPELDGRTSFELEGVVKGPKGGAGDGTAHAAGWLDLATRDSSIALRLRSVDLAPFQPYLIRSGEAGVAGGRFDLDLDSQVRNKRLHAPGTITITNLELASGDGVVDTFMGIPRRALLVSLGEQGKTVQLDFTLEGDIESPQFSLNEMLATKLAYSLAKTLGLSIGDLVKGVGTLGVKGGEAAGEAAKGLGETILDLLKGKDENAR